MVSNFGLAIAQFVSADIDQEPGVVKVMFGFIPDFVILFSDHGDGGALNRNYWFNSQSESFPTGKFDQWGENLTLIVAGSDGACTRETDGMYPYLGGELIEEAETDNSSPKHVNRAGEPHPADGTLTQEGIAIPPGLQTAGGYNMVVAFRADI